MRKKLCGIASSAFLASGLVLLAMGIGNNLIADDTGSARPCEEKRSNGDCGVSCPTDAPICKLLRDDTCGCKSS